MRLCVLRQAVVNFPTVLTLARILMIPLLVVVFYLPMQWSHVLAAAIFVSAAITDAMDGYLARRTSQITRLGTFLDPVADKLIIVAALALIIENAASWVVTLPALIIIAREIAVSALREWMAELGKAGIVAVSFWGKLKTFVQMLAITALLLNQPFFEVGIALLYLAVILTVWSMFIYLLAAYRHFPG